MNKLESINHTIYKLTQPRIVPRQQASNIFLVIYVYLMFALKMSNSQKQIIFQSHDVETNTSR